MLTANDILQRYDHAKGSRSWFETVWDEIFQCFLPRRMGMYDTRDTQGKDRSVKIYDGTPGGSLMRLAAVLNSTLTNQATNWFLLETDDTELNEMPEVKEWLDKDRDAVRKALENSNFYEQIFEFYVDLCGPATACIYTEEAKDTSKDLYFTTRHLREIVIQEDDQGQINAVYMLREMTAWQIMDRWRNARISGKIPDKVRRKAIELNKPNDIFEVIHAVFPNDEHDERNELNPLKFAFASVWIFKEDKSEIDRGGYQEMSYTTAFWSKASSEQYGRGPGWDALPDVKSLYSMKKSVLRAGEKAVDPPIMMPHSTTTYPASLRPGGMTYFDAQAKNPPFPLQIGQGFPIGREMIEDERNQVRDWFYITQLHLIDSKEMTAEEVRARMAENAKILGPTFGRLNNFLERLFDRVLGILGRKGKLAEVPEVVQRAAKQGTQLKIKFVSPIVKSAAISEVQGITHSASTAIQWAIEGQVMDVLDNFDWDFGIRKVADLDGAPPEFLRDPKKVEAIRKQRRMQQEMTAKLDALEKRAGIAGDLAGAESQNLDNKQRRMAVVTR
jgi:hypothetical protein